jgi:SCAN domain
MVQVFIPACLSPKAEKVNALLTLDESKNYPFVKSQILHNFRLPPSAYLAKFISVKRQGQETYSLFIGKLRKVYSYWLGSKEIDSRQKLIEQNILEQFLSTLPPDVKRWVDGRQPATVNQAAEYADLCYQTQYRGGEQNAWIVACLKLHKAYALHRCNRPTPNRAIVALQDQP